MKAINSVFKGWFKEETKKNNSINIVRPLLNCQIISKKTLLENWVFTKVSL